MNKLIKFEFRKLLRQKSFYVCNIVLICLIFLSALMTKALFDNIEDITAPVPTALDMLETALSGGNITLIIGIFVALFSSEDYTDGTLKNIYAKGYSRQKMYFSKLLAVFFFSFIACIISYAASFAAGMMFFEIGSGFDVHTLIVLIAQTLFVILGYTSLFFTISILFKKTGSSIAGCIVAPIVASLVFNMVDSFLNISNFKLADYWIDGLFNNITQTAASVTNENIIIALLMAIAYAAAFYVIGTNICKKQQL